MKILFVAMAESIHTARWISQIVDKGWEIHLFPSKDFARVNQELTGATVHHYFYGPQGKQPFIKHCGIPVFSNYVAIAVKRLIETIIPDYRVNQLAHLIDKLQPDIIHSLEIQHAGYLTLEARKRCKKTFPTWIVTNWGSDIYLYGRMSEHELKIKEVLSNCNYYSCECRRDICLAKAHGFTGTVLPLLPNTGGFDLVIAELLRIPGPISARRLIMLKGYQHWAGRALVGLRALERCADLIGGYEIAIYCATPDVDFAARLFEQSTGVPVTIIPHDTSHEEMLAFHGRARLSIGLSIGDAISTSFLEALVMGSFPIQSWTSCADEWVDDGVNGLLVPPEDPEIIENAIRRALTDDALVNHAAELNWQLAMEKLDNDVIRHKVSNYYEMCSV